MAVETAILPLMEKLMVLKEITGIIDPTLLDSQVKPSIKILTEVQKSLEDQRSSGFSTGHFLKAVYGAEDTIDNFLMEMDQQKLLVEAMSAYIQPRFSDEMQKIMSVVRESSNSTTGKKELTGLAELIMNGQSSPFPIWVVDVLASAMTNELRKIYDSEDIEKHFQSRAWVSIPEDLEKTQLVNDILKQVAAPIVEEKSPQQMLRNFLIQRRYLVVLIDVQTPDIWEILRFLFPNSSNGSRVILSFREADAARHRNVEFFGGELLLNPNDKLESSNRSEDVVDDTITQQVSDAEIINEERDIVGLEDQILDLARVVVNGSRKNVLISVVGRAGSGKTTLVKTIYNSSYTKQNFKCRAWVNVYISQDFDERNVVTEILEHITQVKVEEELPLNELESKLFRILNENRYLIVLDDVHLPGVWYDLKWIFSSKSSRNGSRVILITREDHVARSFSPSIVLLRLRPLNEDESSQLFKKKVGEVESQGLLGKIWKICDGLPLAVSVLGGWLSTISPGEWSGEIEKIESGGREQAIYSRDQSNSPDKSSYFDTSSIWDFGYKFLSPQLRACLQYLCFFPKSHNIPVRRLLQLWLAERVVIPTEDQKIALEDRVMEGFRLLERRSMIEVVQRRSDGRPKTCRMPISLYDVISPKAKYMGIFHIHQNSSRSESTSSSEDFCVRRLAEHLDNQNKTSPSDKDFTYLHSYVSFDNRIGDKPAEQVGLILNKTITERGYGLLRVLDLEGVYKPKLPKTIGKLRLLRYVGLRWTFLDSVPESVGDLPCLETLDVKHTNITTLPMSIWKGNKLRHLYMNDIHFKMSIQKPFIKYSFSDLQTLWGLLIGNKCPPENWFNGLSKLRKLGLTCHTVSLGEITKQIEGLKSLESLRLRSINDFGEPSDLNCPSLEDHEKLAELYLLGILTEPLQKSKLPPKLKILTLSLSHLSEDPMPVLGQLNELNMLRLFAHSYMGDEMTCEPGGFPKLEFLKLWVLKEIKKWDIKDGSMPALRELEIRDCRKLNNPNGLEKVTTLKELKLTGMETNFIDEVKKSMPKSVHIDLPPDLKN